MLHDLSRSQWLEAINEWIFDEIDRKLLEKRLLDGFTYDELSEIANLSSSQVKRRLYKAQEKLYKHI